MAAMSVPSPPPARSAQRALGEVAPSRQEFRELARDRRVIPVTMRLLADAITPVGLYATLAGDRPGTFLLESAENGHSWSRWSFVGVAAPAALTERDGHAHWLGERPSGCRPAVTRCALGRHVRLCTPNRWPGLPPLTGGMVGYLGYDVVRRLERIGKAHSATGGPTDALSTGRPTGERWTSWACRNW